MFLLPGLSISAVEAPAPEVWVTNQASDDRVWVLDTETLELAGTVNLENIPARVAISPDGAFAWVTVVVNAAALQQAGKPLPGAALASPAALKAWVSQGPSDAVSRAATGSEPGGLFANEIAVIDTRTRGVAALLLTEAPAPFGIAIAPDGSTAWITHLGGGITVIDTVTLEVAASIPLEGEGLDIAIDPAGEFAYVTNSTANQVALFDTATYEPAGSVDVGEAPSGIAISPWGDTAWVTNLRSDDVTIIDLATNTPRATLPAGTAPGSVALHPRGTLAFVTNQLSGDVTVIDTDAEMTVATIAVGDTPIDVALHPDGGVAYVTNLFSDSLAVIDTETHTVTASVPAGFLPEAVAVAPQASTRRVAIDVRPGNAANRINPRSRGSLWVALLSDAGFDPLQADVASIALGRDGARASRSGVRDVNADGRPDLLLRFDIAEVGIECGDTEVVLSGEMQDGQGIRGSDAVRTVGCAAGAAAGVHGTFGPDGGQALIRPVAARICGGGACFRAR